MPTLMCSGDTLNSATTTAHQLPVHSRRPRLACLSHKRGLVHAFIPRVYIFNSRSIPSSAPTKQRRTMPRVPRSLPRPRFPPSAFIKAATTNRTKLGRRRSIRSRSRNGSQSSMSSVGTIGSQISDEPVDPVHSTLEHLQHRLWDLEGQLVRIDSDETDSLLQVVERFKFQVDGVRTAIRNSESHQLPSTQFRSRE